MFQAISSAYMQRVITGEPQCISSTSKHMFRWTILFVLRYFFRRQLRVSLWAAMVIALSRVSIASGCRARQTRSFVYALITVFVSSIEARPQRAAVERRSILPRKIHRNAIRPSQLKSLCRGTKNRSDLARHAPSSRAAGFVLPRAATWYRLWGKATNITSRSR
jgi:hypothetical protein